MTLLCACRYSVPPEHGKRLERLAKGTGIPPLLAMPIVSSVGVLVGRGACARQPEGFP